MKKMIYAVILIISIQTARASIYVAAHADDIELFMAQNAWTDIQSGDDNTVFILTTASDDGHGDYIPNGVGKNYMRARLTSHERAIRFWLGSGGTAVDSTATSLVVVNGKSIERSVIAGKYTLYNLNLPDGDYSGTGYSATGNQSLAKLFSGSIRTITAVTANNATSYTLSELQATIQAIFALHGRGKSFLWVNMLDENASNNPDDHSDHITTARIVAAALSAPAFRCVSVARYTSYVNSTKPVNMSSNDIIYHYGAWAAQNSALIDGGNISTWDHTHNVWIGRQYLTTQAGSGSCNF